MGRPSEPGELTVLAVTWNVGGMADAEQMRPFVQSLHSLHCCDICAIGLQELGAAPLRFRHVLDHSLRARGFARASSVQLEPGGWMYLVLYIREALKPLIGQPYTDSVPTGIANVVGNKGAVAISTPYAGVSFLFVCCHLTAHVGNLEERNEEYRRIVASLFVPRNRKTRSRTSSRVIPQPEEPQIQRDITNQHDTCFWLGDLNYRVEGNRGAIDLALQKGMMEVMHENDQLLKEMRAGRAFDGFSEAELGFHPTYKLDVGTRNFDSSKKQRVPSWTDRVLFRSSPTCTLHCKLYDRVDTLLVSDHLPVFAVVQAQLHTARRVPDKHTKAQQQPRMIPTCFQQ